MPPCDYEANATGLASCVVSILVLVDAALRHINLHSHQPPHPEVSILVLVDAALRR